MPVALEQGYERDRLAGPGLVVRWWFFAHVTGEEGRPQRPRLGVPDDGFRFARGGRTATPEEAEMAITDARIEAAAELEVWRGQPSHALGPGGRLVPLGQLELPA